MPGGSVTRVQLPVALFHHCSWQPSLGGHSCGKNAMSSRGKSNTSESSPAVLALRHLPPRTQMPIPPEQSVELLCGRHISSQHSPPLHTALATSVQLLRSQQPESSSHCSPASSMPLPQTVRPTHTPWWQAPRVPPSAAHATPSSSVSGGSWSGAHKSVDGSATCSRIVQPCTGHFSKSATASCPSTRNSWAVRALGAPVHTPCWQKPLPPPPVVQLVATGRKWQLVSQQAPPSHSSHACCTLSPHDPAVPGGGVREQLVQPTSAPSHHSEGCLAPSPHTPTARQDPATQRASTAASPHLVPSASRMAFV